MLTKTTKNLLFVFPVFVLLVLSSCQKGVDIDLDNPPPLPGEVTDSTLLVKSIKLVTYDPTSGLATDSIKEDYFYDTVNKKIILTFDKAASGPDYSHFGSIDHSYNTNGLLTNVVYKYANGFVPGDDDMVSVSLDYDADKVIQKIAIHYFSGEIRNIVFKKTSLSSGKYQLNWTEPFPFSDGDTTALSAVFDATGKPLNRTQSYSYIAVTGPEEIYTKIINTDSLYYDAQGSVSKIIWRNIDTLRQIDELITSVEFTSRQSKGDQLYNIRQVLLNGMANIPVGEDVFNGSISGILSFFSNGFEPMEYSKYPFQAAKVYDGQTQAYDNFTGVSTFDSKDRLTKLRGFLAEVELEPYEWSITYYK